MSEQLRNIGDEVILQASFRNRDGVLTNPSSVSGWMLEPDGTVTALSFAVTAVAGVWEAVYEPNQAGDHWWRVEATGSVKTAAEQRLPVATQRVQHG